MTTHAMDILKYRSETHIWLVESMNDEQKNTKRRCPQRYVYGCNSKTVIERDKIIVLYKVIVI